VIPETAKGQTGLRTAGLLALAGLVLCVNASACSIPLSYFIDRKGEFVGKVMGYRKWDVPEARSLFASFLEQDP